jgi:hypothetical protein
METVACLKSKCHLKQNLIPSWQWSFRHTSCISDFWCKTKYTNKKFCRTPGPAYLAVLPVLVIFCPLGPTNFKKSGSSVFICSDYPSKPHFYGSPLQSYADISPSPFKRFRPIKSRVPYALEARRDLIGRNCLNGEGEMST